MHFYKQYKEEINSLLYDAMDGTRLYAPSELFGDKWDKENPLEFEQLPFDIRIRRIMQYELAKNTPQKEKEEKREKLISCLYDALKAISNL